MQEKTLNFDHHYHGPFDFSPKWRFIQGYWSGNLLKSIVDTAIEKSMDILSIVTEDFGEEEKYGGLVIRPDSIRNKFFQLKKAAMSLPSTYAHDAGNNVLRVQKGNKEVYIVHAQTTVVRDEGKRLDHLVIGGNPEKTIPNLLSLDDTTKWIRDNYDGEQIIPVAEHVGLVGHFALSEGRFIEEYLMGNYVALEFNAQMICPRNSNSLVYKMPIIGHRLKQASKTVNDENEALGAIFDIPVIGGSDGHRREHLGLAYTQFPEGSIDFTSEGSLLKSIRQNIIKRNFKLHKGYATPVQWIRWLTEFSVGHGFRLPHSDLTAEHRRGTFND